jgi:iron complex outermembrane recepter protein
MRPSSRFRKRLLFSTIIAPGWLAVGAVAPAFAQSAPAPTTTTPVASTAKHHAASKHHATSKTAKVANPATTASGPVTGTSIPVAPVTATAGASAAVLAQGAAGPQQPPQETEAVTVTGSLIRDPNTTSASPIEELSMRDLQRRGIKTVTDALQQLSSNGSGNLTNAFGANGAFAAGASAPSLHGLTTDSTLVLMDGQRLSYYPLADDGERDFVDTNWMPASIMERIDVLEDGGSARYGADAVAGVINFITRKEIKGFEGNAEGGLTQGGYGGHQRLYATYGHGDLERDGYNFYVNSEYQQDDAIMNNQVGYPFNTSNLSGIGGQNYITNNPNAGAIGVFGGTPNAMVAPVVNGQAGNYQLLNPSTPCAKYGNASSGSTGITPGQTFSGCSLDATKAYSQIVPDIRRINATAHFTANVTPRSQLTAMFTYSQTLSSFIYTRPAELNNTFTQDQLANTTALLIPATLPNGQLNPNDPFASKGEAASMYYQFGDLLPQETTYNQNFRGSVRYDGSAASHWGSDWNYDVNFTGMNSDLTQTYTGFPTVNGIENAVTNGTYNFVNPSQNSASVLNTIAPKDVVHDNSAEYSGEATLSKGLFRLPGGMAKLAIGTNIRYESLNAPNGNPANLSDPGAQYFEINPVNAQGSRWVESGFFEVGLPFTKMLSMDVSGRYDNYSGGYHHYTPQVGITFKPVKQFTLRGTFSHGFRVPSFSELNGSTVGYVNLNLANGIAPASFIQAHGGDSYVTNLPIGLNTSGNKDLKAEVATNFSGGAVIKPVDWITLSADYYYIKKSNYIYGNPAGQNAGGVIADWLTGQALPSGVTVTPGAPDPLHPNAPVAPGIVNFGYVNTPWMRTDGVQLGFTASHRLPGALHEINWYSKGEMTYVHSFAIGTGSSIYEFAGTVGPFNTTSASGTPRWRANWANTFTWRKLSATPTVYYTSGYKATAADVGVNACGEGLVGFGQSPTNQCHIRNYWDVDLTLNYQINRHWSVYANVYNLLGFRSPYDFATYGAYLYNSSWSQKSIVMRSFQFGANVNF